MPSLGKRNGAGLLLVSRFLLHKLLRRVPLEPKKTGRLTAIFMADHAGAPMRPCDQVLAVAGAGLAEDRYAMGRGFWRLTDGCEVTVIYAEELARAERRQGLSLAAGQHRRNLVVSGLARTYLAWVSIVTDVEAMRLNLDQLQAKQAKDEREESGKALLRTVRDTFRWLLSPVQEVRKGRLDPTILWEAVQVSAAAQNLVQEIQNKLRDNGWLITQWSPIHLANILNHLVLQGRHHRGQRAEGLARHLPLPLPAAAHEQPCLPGRGSRRHRDRGLLRLRQRQAGG